MLVISKSFIVSCLLLWSTNRPQIMLFIVIFIQLISFGEVLLFLPSVWLNFRSLSSLKKSEETPDLTYFSSFQEDSWHATVDIV